MRERPLFALATVATAVVCKYILCLYTMKLNFESCGSDLCYITQGIWTVFPYLLAASTALFLFMKRRYSS